MSDTQNDTNTQGGLKTVDEWFDYWRTTLGYEVFDLIPAVQAETREHTRRESAEKIARLEAELTTLREQQQPATPTEPEPAESSLEKVAREACERFWNTKISRHDWGRELLATGDTPEEALRRARQVVERMREGQE